MLIEKPVMKESLLKYLKKIYSKWMQFAHLIGKINTIIILTIVYYSVFLVYSLFIKLLGKDYLDVNLNNSNNGSYWYPKEPFNRENFFKRF